MADELGRAASGYLQAVANSGDRNSENEKLSQENMKLKREIRSQRGKP